MTCLRVNLLLIYAAGREAGGLWASLQSVTFCIAVQVKGSVKTSQPHEVGDSTPVISAGSSVPGETTQAVTQTDILFFFNQHFTALQLCHCTTFSD